MFLFLCFSGKRFFATYAGRFSFLHIHMRVRMYVCMYVEYSVTQTEIGRKIFHQINKCYNNCKGLAIYFKFHNNCFIAVILFH